MVNEDRDLLEIIDAIIPSLNGYGPQCYGPKVMEQPRYLILLYVAAKVELFKGFGKKVDNITYFTARSLEKVAKDGRFKRGPFKYERSRAMKNHYLHYESDGLIVHTKRDQIDIVTLAKKGEEYCETIIESLLEAIPEQNRPKGKLTNVVPTHQTSSPDQNFEKECQSYGLNWLRADYFELHKSTERDFDNWKKGFEFDLPSIKAKKELRREALVADIKNKLENEGRLLIVGQSGSSKTTILMELICDYFDAGYEVLYNYGMTNITNLDGLINFIEDILKKDKKILVAIDNAHKEKTHSIFYFIDKVSNSQLAKKLKIIMTARKPDFGWLLNGLEKVEEEIRKSIKKLSADPNFIYQIPYFSKEETKEFIKLYSGTLDEEEIYNDTKGDPVMVKFAVFGRGLEQDVEEMSNRYLRSQLARKTMLICSLLDISNTEITDKLLEKCGVLEIAHNLDGSVLRRYSDGSWKTKHTRWDLELFSFFYNKKSGTLLEQRKQNLKDSLIAPSL